MRKVDWWIWDTLMILSSSKTLYNSLHGGIDA